MEANEFGKGAAQPLYHANLLTVQFCLSLRVADVVRSCRAKSRNLHCSNGCVLVVGGISPAISSLRLVPIATASVDWIATDGQITYSQMYTRVRNAGMARPSVWLVAPMTWEQLTASDSPAPRSKLLLGKLGFVAIGGFLSGIPEEQSKYASSVQRLIRDVDAQNPCGWIVDLRENTGGNMWPMLAGIGPILGKGKAGSFVESNGDEVDWSYRDGQAFAGDEVFAKVNGPAYQLKAASPPVAVLTGINTASSGEAIVVSFRGRPNTRSFGRYTTGVSTANADFPMSDGAWIVLTVAVFADRTGQTYGDRIYPDELVDDVRRFTIILKEAIPQPVIDWLMSQPACMAQQ